MTWVRDGRQAACHGRTGARLGKVLLAGVLLCAAWSAGLSSTGLQGSSVDGVRGSSLVGFQDPPSSSEVRWSLLLLTVDTLRPDHLGAYGYPGGTTPELDAFAAGGAVFPNAFAVSSWTFPGLVSLLTGVYPATHGYDARGRSIAAGLPTLQAELKRAGYRVPALSYVSGVPGIEALQVEQQAAWIEPEREAGAKLVQWLRSPEAREGPFFAWYHYRGLHLPYGDGTASAGPTVDGAGAARTDGPGRIGGEDGPAGPDAAAGTVGVEGRVPGGSAALPVAAPVPTGIDQVRRFVVIPAEMQSFVPGDRPAIVDLYDAQFAELDGLWGQVTEALQDTGLLGRTLVVVTADHGEELLEHGLVGHASTTRHATLFDEVLRIPLIVRVPGEPLQAPACQVSQVDVMPTVLSLLGLPVPEGVEGRDLAPALRGAPCADRPVFAESILGGFQARGESARTFLWAVRTPEWKLVLRRDLDGGEVWRLYDLVADPAERHDVHVRTAEVAARLQARLEGYFAARGGADYWKRAVEDAPPPRPGRAPERITTPPRILRPDGPTLDFEAEGGMLAAEWSGSPVAGYVVEYDVGTGRFRTSGRLEVEGNRLEFGPVPADLWDQMVQYNPWRFRVWPAAEQEQKSEWVEVELEAVGSAGAGS